MIIIIIITIITIIFIIVVVIYLNVFINIEIQNYRMLGSQSRDVFLLQFNFIIFFALLYYIKRSSSIQHSIYETQNSKLHQHLM